MDDTDKKFQTLIDVDFSEIEPRISSGLTDKLKMFEIHTGRKSSPVPTAWDPNMDMHTAIMTQYPRPQEKMSALSALREVIEHHKEELSGTFVLNLLMEIVPMVRADQRKLAETTIRLGELTHAEAQKTLDLEKARQENAVLRAIIAQLGRAE